MRREPPVVRLVRWGLTAFALAFLAFFLLVPLGAILAEALAGGVRAYWEAVSDEEAWSAVKLTLIVAAVAVPLNTAFGLVASWALAKFRFRGRSALLSLIDLPFAISPVVSGLLFVLIFGAQGWMGPWLKAHDIHIIFAVPGIVLATVFVTFPFVARELIPLMESQGNEQEEAALVLGASGWRTFWAVTLPNVRWGLFYGVVLCTARALGEFGAVSVVSSRIRGRDVTVPLQVEGLYQDAQPQAAFAVASLLAVVGLVTLVVKSAAQGRGLRLAEVAHEH